MTKSPRYYQIRRAVRAVRKLTRGRGSWAIEQLNEMRVREYSSYFRCGLAEFGLEHDPAASRILGAVCH